MPFDIDTLKAQQDHIDERKAKLREKFEPLCQKLFDALCEFVAEGLRAKLRGVGRCETSESNAQIELRLSLNGILLALVSPNHLSFLHSVEEALAHKVFAFSLQGARETPFAQFTCREPAGDGPYYWELEWATKDGQQITARNELTGEGAQYAANSLVELVYRLRSVWRRDPRYTRLQQDPMEGRSIGFLPRE